MENKNAIFEKAKTGILIFLSFVVVVANLLVLAVPVVKLLEINGNDLVVSLLALIADNVKMQDEHVFLVIVALVYFAAALVAAILFFRNYFKKDEKSFLRMCSWINLISCIISFTYAVIAYLLTFGTAPFSLFLAIFIPTIVRRMIEQPIWGSQAKQQALLEALKPYQELLALGVLSEAEFEAKKSALISEYLK